MPMTATIASGPSRLVGLGNDIVPATAIDWPLFIAFCVVVVSIAAIVNISLVNRSRTPVDQRALRHLCKRLDMGESDRRLIVRLAKAGGVHPLAVLISPDARKTAVRAVEAETDEADFKRLADRIAAAV